MLAASLSPWSVGIPLCTSESGKRRPNRVDWFTQDHPGHPCLWSLTSFLILSPLKSVRRSMPKGRICGNAGIQAHFMVLWRASIFKEMRLSSGILPPPNTVTHTHSHTHTRTHTHARSLGDVNESLKWALDGNCLIRLITVSLGLTTGSVYFTNVYRSPSDTAGILTQILKI